MTERERPEDTLLASLQERAKELNCLYEVEQILARLDLPLEEAFQQVDVIAGPTSPTTAFKIGEKSDDPLAMYLNDVFAVPEPATMALLAVGAMALLRKRLTDEDRQAIFDLLSGLLRKHLSEPEYHRYFLKTDHSPC
mgnify:CR=1 FL=1